MKMPRTQAFFLLVVCLSLGFSFVFPLFDRRWTAEATIFGRSATDGTGYQYLTNNIWGSAFTAGSNGNVTSITALTKLDSGTSINISFGIYQWITDTNAGNCLGTTYETKLTSTTATWYTLNTKANIPIVGGTKYILVIFAGNSTGSGKIREYGVYTSSGSGLKVTSGLTYPTFPSPLTGEASEWYKNDIYATYTEDVATTPVSSVDTITPYWKKATTTITATATDGSSEDNVKNVSLWYRYSTDNSTWGSWKNFGLDTASPWSWSFTFTNGSGYYQFYTIATDVDGNVESAPGSADQNCGYDAILPTSSVDAITPYIQTTSPITVNVTAADTGYSGLKNVSLWSRNSSDNTTWGAYTKYGTDTASPWSWSYPLTTATYYQFYSQAIDNATNQEPNSTMGYLTTAGGGVESRGNNEIVASWFTAPDSFTIYSLSAYMRRNGGTSMNISYGVYTWVANNNVGVLLGSTYEVKVTSTTNTWYKLSMRTPLNVVSGTKYFFAEYIGNGTGSSPSMYLWKQSFTAGSVFKVAGGTYPTFPSPLTGETGQNLVYLIYTSYHTADRAIYANLVPARSWTSQASGWNSFYNTVSWLIKNNGYNSFRNTASPVTVQSGYNSFGNTSAWTDQTGGWNSFKNTVGWLNRASGWTFFENMASYHSISHGFSTFGNLSIWEETIQGWDSFGNTANWTDVDQGYNSFGNTLGFIPLEHGWNTFGNQSSWIVLEQGWNTFKNTSYLVITYLYPDNNSLVCPVCYDPDSNDTAMVFAVNISQTNGTHMDIIWSTWNGTVLGELHNKGNGTWHILPTEDIVTYPYDMLFNYTVNVTDGAVTVTKVISFGTDTEVNCMQFLWNIPQFGMLIVVMLFMFFFYIGYKEEKRSAGAFLLVAGMMLLGLCIFAYSLLPAVLIGLILIVSIFVVLLGINKWLLKPHLEKKEAAKKKARPS